MKPATVDDKMLEFLEKNEPCTISDVARGLGIHQNAVGTILGIMAENGRICIKGSLTHKIVSLPKEASHAC